MNKIAKASIAGAAGVILLMGGAGSLAYWNNSQTLGSGGVTVSAGSLSAAAVANTTPWSVAFVNAAGTTTSTSAALTPANAAAYKIVPGNKLVYTQSFTVTATGNDLKYRIAVTTPTVGATGLGAKLTPSGDFTVTSGGTTTAGSSSTSYTAASGITTITVSQTFAWAFGSAPSGNSADDNAVQGGTYTLPSTGVVTLTQVDA